MKKYIRAFIILYMASGALVSFGYMLYNEPNELFTWRGQLNVLVLTTVFFVHGIIDAAERARERAERLKKACEDYERDPRRDSVERIKQLLKSDPLI